MEVGAYPSLGSYDAGLKKAALQPVIIFFFCPYKVFKFYLLFYLWLCWVFVAVQTFSSYGEQEELLVSVLRLLLIVASLVAQHRLLMLRVIFSNCSSKALGYKLSSCGAQA